MNQPHLDLPKRPRRGMRKYILLLLIISLCLNLVALFWYLTRPNTTLGIVKILGDDRATDKIAVVKLTGVINESTIPWPIKQLEIASVDPTVKAIVFRVDSPGGTIAASDELYQCLLNARDNTGRLWTGSAKKPIITSMGSVAASGGYYTAVVGQPIFAERSTITGSIGVFAAIPNATEFGEKHGIKVELIKAGGIKASGSMFQTMSPLERQPWQEMVDHAYAQFLNTIATERPNLKVDQLQTENVIDTKVPNHNSKGNVIEGTIAYSRVRADGGTFTSTQAKQFGLIDEIGDLPTAIAVAATKAGLTKYKAISYERPKSWSEQFIGFDLGVMSKVNLAPQLWYLSANCDMATILGP